MEHTLTAEVPGTITAASKASSAASWPAIFAGAIVAVAVSLILLSLGAGLGFASVSPWPNHGVSATTFTVTAAIWLIVTQWISAAFGGYIAGRLRIRWVGTHVHEIFFRDTAHGFVTWAVATVLVAAVLASSAVSAIGGGFHAATDAAAAGGQAAAAMSPGAMGPGPRGPASPDGGYGVDKLFRSVSPTAGTQQGDSRAEAIHIVANAATSGVVPDADRTYLAELVASRTGDSTADAQKRVDDYINAAMDAQTKLKATADAARKSASKAAIFTALSLLVGAFIASVSAALGGRLRDEHL